MAHNVKFNLPWRELGQSNIEFRIMRNGKRFGTLKISRGAIVWRQTYYQYSRKMGWKKFAGMMQEFGRESTE